MVPTGAYDSEANHKRDPRLHNHKKRAACLISGAFRTTATEAPNVELHLLPIRQQLDQLAKMTAVRIRTGPALGIPNGILTKRTNEELVLGGYTPMEAHACKTGGCLAAPPKTLAGEWEIREAYVQEPWREPPKVKSTSARKPSQFITQFSKRTSTRLYTQTEAVIKAIVVQR